MVDPVFWPVFVIRRSHHVHAKNNIFLAQTQIGYILRKLAEEDQNGINFAVTLPTNKGVIALRLNLTPEYFSRILHELSDLGLIVVEERKIHIPSVVNLRKHGG